MNENAKKRIIVLLAFVLWYFIFGISNLSTKWIMCSDYFPVNKNNWYKSFLFWPIEQFKVWRNGDSF